MAYRFSEVCAVSCEVARCCVEISARVSIGHLGWRASGKAAAAWQLLGVVYNAHTTISSHWPINHAHAQLYSAMTTMLYGPIISWPIFSHSDTGKILLQEYLVHNKCDPL